MNKRVLIRALQGNYIALPIRLGVPPGCLINPVLRILAKAGASELLANLGIDLTQLLVSITLYQVFH